MGEPGALRPITHQEERNNMKKTMLSIALAAVAPFAWGQVSSTTTRTTTEGGGRITEFTPGSVIVLRESSGPRHYRFGKTVTFVTRSGRTLDEETVKTRVRVGAPVHVHYMGEGDNMQVDRVILDED
jgi:hypothetical protein